ncbi:hypothetical protein [Streptomyces sp. NPDC005374]|uniref:hypothetical protein n=1 Tax=Streptomyces sp. NPDC005374 TaxID=3364713 RepID=UPI0036D1E190
MNVTVVGGGVNRAGRAVDNPADVENVTEEFDLRVTPRCPYLWSLMPMQLCGVTT